jgi:site-specific DNA-cytosine methylase
MGRRLEDFTAWYQKLRSQGYKRLDCFFWAVYNSKHYTTEGIYK